MNANPTEFRHKRSLTEFPGELVKICAQSNSLASCLQLKIVRMLTNLIIKVVQNSSSPSELLCNAHKERDSLNNVVNNKPPGRKRISLKFRNGFVYSGSPRMYSSYGNLVLIPFYILSIGNFKKIIGGFQSGNYWCFFSVLMNPLRYYLMMEIARN